MTFRTLKRSTYLGLILLDFLGILMAFFLAYVLRSHIPGENYYLPAKPYFILSIILGIFYLFILHGAGTQKKHPFESFPMEIWTVSGALLKGTIIFMAVSFLYRGFSISRLIVVFHLFLAILFLLLIRLGWRLAVLNPSTRRGIKKRILVIIPHGKSAQAPDESNPASPEEKKFHFLKDNNLFPLDDIESRISKENIDGIELAEKDFYPEFILEAALMASRLRIDMRVKPDLVALMPMKFAIEESGGEMFWTAGRGLHELYPRTLKRIFDLLFSFLVLVILLIPGLLIAFLIWASSPGGIFYRHQRIGVGGKAISILKFRTMYRDAEKRLEAQPELHEEFLRGFKLKNDPRITPIGRFLRRTSLDELPQIINIILGEMSFVGPRPVVEEELPRYGKFKDILMSVPPGLTGLWQVSGRSDLTYDERVRLDLYYVENWTLALDSIIIARTLPVILFSKGAY